jgi:plastocyanin
MNKQIKFFVVSAGLLGILLIPSVQAGTVSGKVSFKGIAPTPEKINMNADPTCVSLHSEPVFGEDVAVNQDGTLRNVFVYVKSGLEGKTFPAPDASVILDQRGCHYNPHVFGVQVNQKVDIINSDSTLHNVHGMPTQSKEFNLGMPIQGMKLSRKFDKPEVMVKFKCDVHPWMRAYAGVLEHPFFSVSGENGSFEIKDLPAGAYTIEAWHEKYGTQTQQVTVDEAGTQTVDFQFAG